MISQDDVINKHQDDIKFKNLNCLQKSSGTSCDNYLLQLPPESIPLASIEKGIVLRQQDCLLLSVELIE